ncbi:MAG: tRNA 2-thiouridine(34) synthase MnmA [Gammaproteobacteria bacterium]|nr:tRNA 2-thiouridine(34) synthase MnmA [Gammaproteobacteria bacterium]
MKQHITVGMSGGVDSSVTAKILVEQEYDVSALFMKNWEEDDGTDACTAVADLADAQQVCDALAIPLKTVNFAHEYWELVFENFLTESAAGRTPNPDILCNQHIKFKAFLDFALQNGADKIATGHYARVEQRDGYFALLKALDKNKDQTYFLYRLNQQALSRCLFPLGTMQKPEVRKIAIASGFDNHAKKDSTGICFIGERNFRPFLQRFLPAQPGEIQTTEGQVLGEHQGLMYYTLGQRQGLGIGGVRGIEVEQPWYVVKKDLTNNVLVVGQGHDHSLLFSQTLNADQLTWLSGKQQPQQFRCHAKSRYRQADQACSVELDNNQQSCQVQFEQPQRALTPGQSIVFYQDDECIGGGVIQSVG